MKNKIKIIFGACIFLMSASGLKAQLAFGGGLGVHFPSGDFANGFNPGIGFHVEGKYFVQDQLAIGLTIGYNGFPPETSVGDFSFSSLPILLAGEYHFSDNKISPLAGFGLGLYTFKSKVTIFSVTSTSSDSYLGVAPYAGVKIGLSDQLSIHPALRYNVVFSDNESTTYLSLMASVVYIL